jgi:hypothetical protein
LSLNEFGDDPKIFGEFVTIDFSILLKYTPAETIGKMNSRPRANEKEEKDVRPERAYRDFKVEARYSMPLDCGGYSGRKYPGYASLRRCLGKKLAAPCENTQMLAYR